jgi:hypothetical protein
MIVFETAVPSNGEKTLHSVARHDEREHTCTRGKMAAGYVNLREKSKRQQRKMGHEEEGSSSNRPELAAFVLVLRGTPVTKPMLYLCDNQALLKPSKRWVVEGGKATLVGAPDADIVLEAIEELRKRTTAGAATFLVKR